MKKYFIIFITALLTTALSADTENPLTPTPADIVAQIPETKKISRKKREKMVEFNFKNGEDLVKIINKFAGYKNINIILPQGANAINQQVTFKMDKKIPLSEAEKYVHLFLDLAGYTMFPNGSFYIITKTDPNTVRNPFPLYINVKPQDLPNTEDKIRAIFYLSNLKVPADAQAQDPLNSLLQNTLSVNTQFLYDPKSNGIIITDKANRIASAMTIITELDAANTRDVLEEVPLFNSNASTLAQLIKTQLLAVPGGAQPSLLRSDIKTESSLYFSSNLNIVADTRTNKLYLIGRQSAVNRLRDFIREYLDADPDSGKSILHVYDLQYLSAEDFAPTLQNIVAVPAGASGGDQSTASATGPERYFDSVQVVAETLTQSAAPQQVATGTAPPAENNTAPTPATLTGTFTGGNRLIIAAKNSDWKRIKELIADLDKPQPQVIIEVLIVDLTFQDQKTIAAQTRNPSALHLPKGVQFQAAHITAPITNATINTSGSGPTNNNDATNIAGDLLRLFGSQSVAATQTAIGAPNSGALIVSFNDFCGQSGIWGLLEILQAYSETRVLSHPYLITLNNFQAQESLSTIRRLRGEQSVGEGAVSSLRQTDVPATLNISVVPRVASNDRLNLQISIAIDQFQTQDPNDGTRITRQINTTANLTSGQILILGGLTQIVSNEAATETPLLAKIPLLGWLFKSNGLNFKKTNLAVFISPTVINPKLRGGQTKYTADKVNGAYQDMNDGQVFDNLRDPITRWFFKDGRDSHKSMLTGYVHDAAPNKFIPFDEPADIQEPAEMIETNKLKKLLAEEKNPLEKVNPAPDNMK